MVSLNPPPSCTSEKGINWGETKHQHSMNEPKISSTRLQFKALKTFNVAHKAILYPTLGALKKFKHLSQVSFSIFCFSVTLIDFIAQK